MAAQHALAGTGTKRLVVLDEAWAVLSHLATARWLQATFKLSRSYGVANIAVVHRLSDLKAAGQEGSEQQRLAEGLLDDAETRSCSARRRPRPSGPASFSASPTPEAALAGQLPRGVALWRVGAAFLPRRARALGREVALADTDTAMRAVPGTGN